MAKITCSMCGHLFEPNGHSACSFCPLQKGCQFVCCPACGFETIDPQQSLLVRLVKQFSQRKKSQPARKVRSEANNFTLANSPTGRWVEIEGFLPGLPLARFAQLQAYGLAPGSLVFVMQHTPVTIVRIEHLELALEKNLAAHIQVADRG